MENNTDNGARIVDGSGMFGLARLEISILTKIQNAKRRTLFIDLALEQLALLEQAVGAMPYEEIEKALKERALEAERLGLTPDAADHTLRLVDGNGKTPT